MDTKVHLFHFGLFQVLYGVHYSIVVETMKHECSGPLHWHSKGSRSTLDTICLQPLWPTVARIETAKGLREVRAFEEQNFRAPPGSCCARARAVTSSRLTEGSHAPLQSCDPGLDVQVLGRHPHD